jgi:predicted pyridoxine 5'-phosphate oxidase superfamily flavin-nucleotide-binding protein
VIDPKTVCFADWPGNNKIATLRNLTERDQVAMLFLFPGLDIFMRINGRAGVTVDEPLLEQLTEDNRRPKTAIVVMVDYVFYHCGKAINRARLWKPDAQLERRSLPSPGVMMKELAKIEDLASEDLDRKYDDAMKHELYTGS